MGEVYVSGDIETDGPIPGPNSMLSLGASASTSEKGLISTFSVNFQLLPGASPDPKTTKEFWDKNPEAWAACRVDPIDPRIAMDRFVSWVNKLPGKPVFVGYPASFDFMFVYWYLIRFTGNSPFSFSALDIKSYVSGMMATPFRESTKRNMPSRWFPKDRPHTHVALDDALEQGELYMNILKENLARPKAKP